MRPSRTPAGRRLRFLSLVAAVAALLAGIGLSPANAALTAPDSALAGPTAEQLRAKIAACGTQVSSGKYAQDAGGTRDIPVCGKGGAVFWTADLDVDCDGKRTAECNENTDPWWQNQTACVESDGQPLNSATLPHIVIPLKSSTWDPAASGLGCGTVGAVIYQDKVVYGVIGDRGPSGIIGEASYAAAKSLGMNPSPSSGGVSGKVVGYVTFPGTKVTRNEDHPQAVQLGEAAATKFIQADTTCDEVSLDASAYTAVKAGSSGSLVKAAQCLLKTAGFDPASYQGEFDAGTETAVKGFQTKIGLPATGEVEAHTWTALLSYGTTPTLQSGSTGTAVKRLQRALTAALGKALTIDGSFGANTTSAVKTYQSARGLTADGVVGANTWQALQSGK
ncbi:peptidoglycan-binding protein [Streptomyces sp. A7024]|uniref:Peptidoglycan-binding protein n=1 Tax=Streptomyces coryli TaxID=1128680 RepID=A0A6G4TZ95_9ACTN|nr:peptidoglycan-binding protein [Streptomyces coryli]NGN65214.1 peptidoglycan-binding protein [Streptomyces coryli]